MVMFRPNEAFRSKLLRLLPGATFAAWTIYKEILVHIVFENKCPNVYFLVGLGVCSLYVILVPWIHSDSHIHKLGYFLHALFGLIAFLALAVFDQVVCKCLLNWYESWIATLAPTATWILISIFLLINHHCTKSIAPDRLMEEIL